MLNYYAHTFCKYDNYKLSDINILEKILDKGYLLSRRKLGLKEEDSLFNGMDYISLCDLEKEHPEYSAYNMYIKNNLSLLFDKNIETIDPIIVHLSNGLGMYEVMHYYGKVGRFTDLIDEVQVKDKVSLENLRGLVLSLNKIKLLHDKEYIKKYLVVILSLLEKYHYDVPIYNLDDNRIIKLLKKSF